MSSSSSPSSAESSTFQQPQPFSQLVQACQVGDFRKVNQLITSGEASVLETAPDGVTPLHWAAINNRLNICRYLLDQGASIDAKGGDLQGTPLHWACRTGLVYIVHLLISRGADPLRTDSQGFNALHLAVHSSNVLLVIYLLHLEMPVDPTDMGDRTPLHWAAYQGDALSVDALLNWGADTHCTDSKGFTALHWAIVRGSKQVIKRLLEANSDVYAMSNDGKTPRVVAEEMNVMPSWKGALKECGRDPTTGAIKPKWCKPKTAKIIMFFTPYIILFFILQLSANLPAYFSIPLSLILTLATLKLLGRLVLPSISTSPHALMQTPFFSGIFSGTAFWVLVHYTLHVFPATLFSHPFTNFIFIPIFGVAMYSFFQSMFRDPGYIPPLGNVAKQRGMIEGLIEGGEYDTRHFCISTYIRKPLRARYDRVAKRVVAKYDHYCPWTYNVIGVRNHRVFVAFVLSLTVGIPLYIYLFFKYTGQLQLQIPSSSPSAITTPTTLTAAEATCPGSGFFDGTMCHAFSVDYYGTLLTIWTSFNGVWVFFLAFVQVIQVARGVTTNEASNLHRFGYMGADDFSSLPLDHSTALNTALANSAAAATASAAAKKRASGGWNSLLRLLGIDQFIATARDAVPLGQTLPNNPYSRRNPADLGCMRNCSDFWFPRGSYNILRELPDGAASFAGNPIDYYRMWDFPTRENSEAAAAAAAAHESSTTRLHGHGHSTSGTGLPLLGKMGGDGSKSGPDMLNDGLSTTTSSSNSIISNTSKENLVTLPMTSRDGSAYEMVSNQV